VVATDFALTCGACTCTATATCGGSASFHPDGACGGDPLVLAAGACTTVNQASASSYRWTGTVASQSCANVTPPEKAAVSLIDARTVCCP
jgi:hypothetical protein